MHRNLILSFCFAAGTLAVADLPRANIQSMALDKRQVTQTCYDIVPGPGACRSAAESCDWPSDPNDTFLCYMNYETYECYSPGLGQTCCANNYIAGPGESCSGATQYSGTWLDLSTSAVYPASSAPAPQPSYGGASSSDAYGYSYPSSSSNYGGYQGQYSSSKPWDSGYGSSRSNPTPPGWPGATSTRQFGGYAPSSTQIFAGAGATAAPKLALDAAGIAFAAFGAMMV